MTAFVIGTGVLGYQTAGPGQFNLGETVQYDVIDAPRFVMKIAFSSLPTDGPVWTDVSNYVMEFHTRRGRRSELEQIDTGTMKFKLLNDDRRFEPLYAWSPYYPNVKSRRMVQVGVIYRSQYTEIFTGYIEGYPQTYVGDGHSYVQIDAVDGFAVLAGKKLNATFSSRLSGFRINDVLTEAKWPLSLRFVQDGITFVQESDLEDDSALAHLRLVDKSEGGLMFMAADGNLTFFSRHFRYFTPYIFDQGVFGESRSIGEIPYVTDSIVVESDVSRIFNEIIFTRVDGEPQIAEDATSQLNYFDLTYQPEELLNLHDTEMEDRANYYLSILKDQRLRITGMMLQPTGVTDIDSDLYDQMINRELGDRIRVRRLPPSGGAEIDQPSWIEYIQHDVVRDVDWHATYNVSPVDERQYWELGSATNSLLGETTFLAW